MRAFFLEWGLVALMAAHPAVSMGQGAERGQRPREYPGLPQGRANDLIYSAVALDTWTGKVAYLAFEGNASNGFSRMFAWIPNDTRFGRPVEFKPRTVEGNPNLFVFGEVENKASEGEEKVELVWRFSTVKRTRGAGSSSSLDYVTGKTVSRNWDAAVWHEIHYALKVGYSHGRSLAGLDRGMPLELTHNAPLSLYSAWTNVPLPTVFNSTTLHARHVLQETRDARKGRFLCQFSGYSGPSVTRAPPEGQVTLLVSPYMGMPVYSNTVPLADFLKSGFETELPYGWYALRMGGFRYGRFSIGASMPHLQLDPVPLSRSSTATP